MSQTTNQSRTVINLSNHQLTPSEFNILESGLKFVPAPKTSSKTPILNAAHAFGRKLKITFHFRNNPYKFKPPKFIPKSTWTPSDDQVSKEVLKSIDSMISEIDSLAVSDEKANITKNEFQALQNLRKNDDLIIKPADKGSATVVMNKIDYISEAERQLANPKHYKQIEEFIYPETAKKVSKILLELFQNGKISEKQYKFLLPPDPIRPRRLYFLPKIHKPVEKWSDNGRIPPGRPIVSDCSSESYEVSKYIDHFLQPLAVSHDSFLKNTDDFLYKLRQVRVKPDSLLVTLDVESMFTNIDNRTGIKAVREAFRKNPDSKRDDDLILELLKLCLENNDFEFNGKKYLQISGTSMGKTLAPGYCNITMAKWETEALARSHYKPTFYKRFLDDIFIIWDHGESKFWEFFELLNNHHPSIKLTATISQQSIDYLDVTVFKGKRLESHSMLDTKVFFKPTDTHQLLSKKSFHPKHTFPGIIKSQIIRFKSICSQNEDFENTCRILFKALRKRNYSARFLRSIKNKTLAILNKPKLDDLIEVDLSNPGAKPCKKPRCGTCPYFRENTGFLYMGKDLSSYDIQNSLTCSSKNIIYYIECDCCLKSYVGETKNTLRSRFNQHRFDIMHKNDTSIADHFNTICTLRNLEVFPIAQCKTFETEELTTKNRKIAEEHFIKLFQTYKKLNRAIPNVKDKDKKLIPFVAPYSQHAIQATKIARKHYENLQENYPNVFKAQFISAFSANKNIKSYLVSSKFKPVER